MRQIGRLFTFGCSFTSFFWPTWADILGQEADYFENWGIPGGGNEYIFNSVNECLLRNKLTSNDTVIIMWTNIWREDRYIQGEWVTPGNIYHSNNQIINDRGYLIRDLAFINSTKEMLENRNIKYIFLAMVPIDNSDQYSVVKLIDCDDVLALYKDTIEEIRPSVYEKIFNFDWHSRQKDREDMHPIPSEYLEYLDLIVPEYKISNKTRQWIKAVDAEICNGNDIAHLWNKAFPIRF